MRFHISLLIRKVIGRATKEVPGQLKTIRNFYILYNLYKLSAMPCLSLRIL